jgi:hypothetical protein
VDRVDCIVLNGVWVIDHPPSGSYDALQLTTRFREDTPLFQWREQQQQAPRVARDDARGNAVLQRQRDEVSPLSDIADAIRCAVNEARSERARRIARHIHSAGAVVDEEERRGAAVEVSRPHVLRV